VQQEGDGESLRSISSPNRGEVEIVGVSDNDEAILKKCVCGGSSRLSITVHEEGVSI
jgi:hypothetical protein